MPKTRFWSLLLFAACLTLAARRAYQYPQYSTDGLAYMGNAVAMSGAAIPAIHNLVYRDAKAGMPPIIFDHLTGIDPTEPPSERLAFHDRSTNPYHFAEFLPCFAVRPLFNELIYVLHFKFGVGLLRSTVWVPVISYWLMGWIIWLWLSRYIAEPWATIVALLMLVSSPVWDLARSTTPDALSCLVMLVAMYLILERRRAFPGVILLLAAIFVRTDNVLLVLPLLAFLYIARFGLTARDAAVLAGLALASVLVINHFAGDYGPRVLYYRSFIEAPVAPGEIVPRFGLDEYLAALKLGVSGAMHGPYIPFLLLGLVGAIRRPPKAILGLAAAATIYMGAHLIIFPNPETRFFGTFFVAMGVTAVSTTTSLRRSSVKGVPVLDVTANAADRTGLVHAQAFSTRPNARSLRLAQLRLVRPKPPLRMSSWRAFMYNIQP